jgi:hypothetical protein
MGTNYPQDFRVNPSLAGLGDSAWHGGDRGLALLRVVSVSGFVPVLFGRLGPEMSGLLFRGLAQKCLMPSLHPVPQQR